MTERATLQSILRKIKALRARAADSASSENEAAMAARKADELLQRHNIDLSEVDVRADGIVKERWDSGRLNCPVESWTLIGINEGCNVASFYVRGVITIIGSPADVETALYYLDLAKTAVPSCWKAFQNTDDFFDLRERGLSARKIGFSFRKGVAIRLGDRIAEFAKSPEREVSGSNALVPVKNAMIESYLKENNIRIRSAGADNSMNASAVGAGMRAADKVGLGRGVNQQRTAALLEG